MKIKLSSDVPVGEFVLNDYAEMQSDYDLLARQGQNSTAYGESIAALGDSCIAYTNNSFAYGESTEAGTRSFRVISGDMAEKSWTLKSVEGLENGMTYSVRILNNYDMVGDISSIDTSVNKIYVSKMPPAQLIRTSENLSDTYLSGMPFYSDTSSGNGLRGHPTCADNEYGPGKKYSPICCFCDFDFDANTLWIVGRPDLGDISAYSTGSHSEGFQTVAQKQYSHSEGCCSKATGKYSHAEGMYCNTGYAAHAEGISCNAVMLGSHAEGQQTSSFGYYSHASGYRASVGLNHRWAFCWQGNNSGSIYSSHGEGTFNINPKNGLSGLYIGEDTLADILADSLADILAKDLFNSAINSAVEGVLRAVMNPTDEESLDKIWKGIVFELDDGKKRVFYSDLSGLTNDGTAYAFPFSNNGASTNPKMHLISIKTIDSRISAIGKIEVDGATQSGFNACRKLEFANIENITSLIDWSFSGCWNLTALNSPNVKYIGGGCFNDCHILSSVSLPSAREFGSRCFASCADGFKLDFSQKTDGIIPQITQNTFLSAPSNLSIIVPTQMLDEWKNAPIWSNYASKITDVV